MKTQVVGCAALALAVCAGTRADVITDWNQLYREAIRQAPNGPGEIARAGAMMHAAMFNAVNAVDQTHNAYGGFGVTAGSGTSRAAAAAVAAHSVLTSLYPASLHGAFDSQLATSLGAIPDGPGKTAGITLGNQAANHIIALRSGDGHDADSSYTPGMAPGDWVPTQAGPAVHPQWGNVTPWGLSSGAQFRPNRLAAYGTMANFLASDEYRDQFNDVKENGRIDRWTPADEQYQIAFFWGNDRNGTFKPPGHLNSITQTFADKAFAGLSEDERLSQNARLYALLNIALADAGIAAWDCKYNSQFDLWRPITGIQNADSDGNPNTISDPTWEPLNHVDPDGAGPLAADPFSPQFPAYISGHATFGAAHAAIMREFFGSDAFDPTLFGTDDPYVQGLQREFSSWEAMARENARSRVYLGVHWQMDGDDGYLTGTGVGEWIFSHYLTAVPTPGSLALIGVAMIPLLRRRR